jgi:hypothetical protein
MNPHKLIGALELAERAGVTYKQIDSWTKLSHLKAEPRQPGTGHKRLYKPGEVRVAQIMGSLVGAGVAAPVAARAARSAILEMDTQGPIFMAELVRGVAVTGRIPA